MLDWVSQNRILLTAIVSVGLWFGTQLARFLRWYLLRNRERSNLVRALYSEIDFNTKDLHFFLTHSPSEQAIKKAFDENKALIPHITDARHTHIYRENIKNLPHISDNLIARLVQFYGLLEKIKEQIDALQYESFPTITKASKVQAVLGITANVRECAAIGDVILDDFSKEYPKLGLTRQFRNKPAPALVTGEITTG